jgi:uncharacterized membrane-anchored protein
MAVERPIIPSEEIEIEEEQFEKSILENIKTIVVAYTLMNDDEKKNLLLDMEISEEEMNSLDLLSQLDWKKEGEYKLSPSNSSISLPKGYILALGKDAVTNYKRENGTSDDDIDAYAYDDKELSDSILFHYYNSGYIPLDDWENLDSKALLDEITRNTKEDNKERLKNGSNELHVIGWIQEPTLNRDTHTVSWAIEADSGADEHIVNAIALQLGREGYERINWITSKSSYVPSGGHLDAMLLAHNFDPEHRYTDYTIGDKVAEYGIAGLVAATIGGTILKAGGFAIFFKKIAAFILAGLGALIYKFKNLFRKNKGEQPTK